MVGGFKSLTGVTFWVRANLPSYAPKCVHFIELDILLAGIQQRGVTSEEFRNKEVHAEILNQSANQYVVVTSFQSNSTENWASSNENNNFSKMTTFKQWNYGDGQRVILTIIKKGIIIHENSSRSSFNCDFTHHVQARLLCNNMRTKTIDFFRKLAMVVEDLYRRLCLE